MKRITLTLSDAEFAALEKHATDERRSVRDMAAYLVVKHTPELPQPTITIGPATTSYPRSCVACSLPGAGQPHTCMGSLTWGSSTAITGTSNLQFDA